MLHKVVVILSLSFFFFLGHSIAYPDISIRINKKINQINQDSFHFVRDKIKGENPIEDYNSKLLFEVYLSYHFKPWDAPFSIISINNLIDYLKARIKRIRSCPGWSLNKRPNTKIWIENIINNIDFDTFPNSKYKGILINNTNLRSLPTATPHFTNWSSEGEGYPFDNLQISYLSAFQPIYVFHNTKNGKWSLILTSQGVVGWVKMNDIGYVDKKFINEWKSKNYITSIIDDKPIKNVEYNKFMATSRLGQILPLRKETSKDYEILTAECKKDGFANIVLSKISKTVSRKAPIQLNENNICRLLNSLINQPYGWGGLHGYRDCSGILRDIFGTCGLFLPRNSKWQSKSGNQISLEGLSDKKKIETIIKRGIPFLTLLYFEGHIMLYIGEIDGVPYVFNTIWGFKTKSLFSSPGRAILGRSVIMPITIKDKYIITRATPIKKLKSMILLNDNLLYPKVFESQIINNINQLDLLECQEENYKCKIHKDLIKNKNIQKLIKIYNDYISKVSIVDENIIFFMKNGSQITWEKKFFSMNEEKLNSPYLKDVFLHKYKVKYPILSPKFNENPGKYINQDFLSAIYGENKNKVHKNLVEIRWMPKTLNKKPRYIFFNKNAGAAAALLRVSYQLDLLSEDLKKYVINVNETNKQHNVARTDLHNPHFFGIAIYINNDYGDHWYLNKNNKQQFKYINQIPEEIIKIFESNGFIWGGRWYHYDTTYFEYRPELLN